MKPFISPFGIILLLPYYWLCFLALRKRWHRLSASPKRWALLLLVPPVLVLPYADELWIAWHFERACREAGVQVYRKVEVEGFFNGTGGPGTDMIEKQGFRFSEGYELGWKEVARIERDGDKWKRMHFNKPQARYHYSYPDPRQWVPAGLQINRREVQVVDSETGEVLGREVCFERYPGFVEGLWLRFLGSGQTICEGSAPKPPELRHLLYHYVLIPKKLN